MWQGLKRKAVLRQGLWLTTLKASVSQHTTDKRMPTPTGEKITSAHLRYLALKDVVQFPSDSYTLASASNVFFLKWSELGKWRILVDASAPYRCSATGTGVKTIYLNASECQISRYSTYIAPKLLAGKNGHLSYHTPSH